MKTRTKKANKSEQFINSIPIIFFILLAVFMNLYSNFSESSTSSSIKIQKSSIGYINGILPPGNQFVIPVNSEENDEECEKQRFSFMISMKGFCLASEVNQNLETDKLIVRNNNILYSKSNSQNSELYLLADKLNEYLVPEIEPELELILLPNSKKKSTANKYIKNEYLEKLRETKVAELERFYAIQLKFKEYLVEEIEPPLEFENTFSEKLRENLVVKIEPELNLGVSPITKKQLTEKKYVKNEYLENLRETKVTELENFYAMQPKCREFLADEIEAPLELEEWMCDENCWCFGNNITFALNDK